MISFVIGLVTIAVTFYVALIYSSTAIALLGFVELVFLILTFFYLQLLRANLQCQVDIPIAVAEQKEWVTVHIIVENKSPFSHQKLRFLMQSGNTFQKKKKRHWENGGAVYRGRTILQSSLYLEHAGSYSVELLKVRVYDKTGWLYLSKGVKKSAAVQILPTVIHVGIRITEPTRNFYGDSDVYDDFRPGHDRSEIFDVREFRDGDKIQSIHWKLSAKTEELVVREDSLPRACPVVLLLESGVQESVLYTDAYLTAAASLVFSLMDAACPHYVAWYSNDREDVVRVRVDDEEGYYLFLSHYMNNAGGQTRDVKKLYKEKYRYENQLHILQLRPDLTVWLDGDKQGVLDKKDLKKSMQNFELVI